MRGDLGGIKALSGVVSSLDETQDLLSKKLTNHFISLCLDQAATVDDGELEKQLISVLYALLNLKWLLKSFDQYKEKTEQQLQEVVHSVISICLGKEAWRLFCYFMYRLGNPAAVKKLSHHDFLSMLDLLCEQFLRIATRSRKIVTVCTNIFATIPIRQERMVSTESQSVHEGFTVEDTLSITFSERELLQQTLQSIHIQSWSRIQQHVGTLLEMRGEIHSQLSIDELKQVWDHSIDFISVAAKIYGIKGKLLLSTLLRQARDSLEFLHKNQIVHLQSLLHEELWKPALVPSNIQNEVTSLQENPRVVE